MKPSYEREVGVDRDTERQRGIETEMETEQEQDTDRGRETSVTTGFPSRRPSAE